jgi:hypothetical protein
MAVTKNLEASLFNQTPAFSNKPSGAVSLHSHLKWLMVFVCHAGNELRFLE